MEKQDELVVAFSATSTNGRWGLDVTAPEGTTWPAKGHMVDYGTTAGRRLFSFVPGADGQWFYVAKCFVKPMAGCVVVHTVGLQSGADATIVAGGDFMVFREIGYKGRSSTVRVFNKGEEETELPLAIMRALGIVPGESAPEVIMPDIPSLGGGLADALESAGF
jgi:hypothetical protein